MNHVLAGDIGGTNARFALFEVGPRGPRRLAQDVLPTREHRTFEAALRTFLAPHPKVKIGAATFGAAGPVVNERVRTTNLPWVIDARSVSRAFSIPTVTLLNDLVAVGLGAIVSPARKLFVLHKGRPRRAGGNLAVIAAGTGLGEAAFIWDGREHVACATEGAHVDFAPQSGLEDELLAILRAEYGHVSYERVAAGSAISRIYQFMIREQKMKETRAAGAAIAAASDPNVAVVELAESGRSEAAARAIDLWASVYGAEAGNLALKCLATAGVFVCGGVSARLAPILAAGLPGGGKQRASAARSPFVEAFLNKGRMGVITAEIPVAVCLEREAGLLGATTHAASAAGSRRP